MKKRYSALLLIWLSFISSVQATPVGPPTHSSHHYQANYADTAETPDEFLQLPLRK